jgi:ankyrin repeat protein
VGRWPTLLHIAASKANTDIAALLLAHGVAVNCRRKDDGVTPLYYHGLCIRFRGCRGLSISARGSCGPRHDYGQRCHPTARSIACENGNTDIMALLFAHNAAVNEPTIDGRTPLFAACQKDHVDVVEILLAHGADHADIERAIKAAENAAAASARTQGNFLRLKGARARACVCARAP